MIAHLINHLALCNQSWAMEVGDMLMLERTEARMTCGDSLNNHHHHHHCHLSGVRRCASNPWPRLIALSHCSRSGVSDCNTSFNKVSRGLPWWGVSTRGRGNDWSEVGLQTKELCLQAHPLSVWPRVQRGPDGVCL